MRAVHFGFSSLALGLGKTTFAVFASLLCVLPTHAQAVLRWTFEKGRVYEVERVASQKQTVEIRGKQFKQERQTTWRVRLEVKEKQADAFVLAATLTKVEDQRAGGAGPDMIDPKLGEKMQGASFALVVTSSGTLVEIKGYEEFLVKLADTDKARLKALRVTFPEANLREAFTDLFGPLPDKSVAPGDSWQRSYAEPIPHFGTLQAKTRYVYDGLSKERDRISYTIQTKYELPKNDAMVLFRIVQGTIASENAKGQIVFDRTAGHLVQHDRTMFLHGTLVIEAMDRPQSLEFTSENTVKIRVKARPR